MEVTYTRSAPAQAAQALAPPRSLAARIDAPALGAWTLAFALVTYLALRGGGYDTVVRSEVGVAVWWIVLLAAAAGVLPLRLRAPGLAAIGLLAGFTVWTGLAVTWSESAERSMVELGRVAAYLGVLVLAVALQGATAARHTINGVASAIGLVTAIAVLSRLHPAWFPPNDHFDFLGEASARKLSYPLNYWNALAGFAAIGVPLLLAVAVSARTLLGQAAAAAALPISGLCVALTLSRGGALAVAVGVAAFLVLAPRRLHAAATLATASAASAILIWAVTRREALDSGLPSAAAATEGDQVLWLAVIACLGVALLQVALGLVARHASRPRALRLTRRQLAYGWLAAGAAALVVAVAAGAPGRALDQWQAFTEPPGVVQPGSDDTVFTRLSAANGNGRYEFWKAAVHANETRPLTGIGPGSFELWWARNATAPGFIRDAHTLYFETLAETGIVGFVLLIGLLALALAVGVARLLRARPALRVTLAAAIAGVLAFMTSAAFEWVWEMGAIAVAVLALIAVIVAGRDEALAPRAPRARALPRVAVVALAVAALGATAVPFAGALAIRDSRAAAADGQLTAALEDARTAERVQPYAATPHLQRALLLEQAGSFDAAAAAARTATVEEPTNWRPWIVLARLEARRGAAPEALAAFATAKRLNPKSDLFRITS